jgi:hypothetical protein
MIPQIEIDPRFHTASVGLRQSLTGQLRTFLVAVQFARSSYWR